MYVYLTWKQPLQRAITECSDGRDKRNIIEIEDFDTFSTVHRPSRQKIKRERVDLNYTLDYMNLSSHIQNVPTSSTKMHSS